MTRQEQAPELLSSFLKFHGSKIQEDFSKLANSRGPIQINPQQCLCLKLDCNVMKIYCIFYLSPIPDGQEPEDSEVGGTLLLRLLC